MNDSSQFTDQQLDTIVEQAFIYMCACPAQIAVQLKNLRALVRYQQNCLSKSGSNEIVHKAIITATNEAHALFERCLDEVLDIEGWDRTTLQMPQGLRELRDKSVLEK